MKVSHSKKFTVPNKDKFVCRDCDFTFFIGIKKLKTNTKPYCPSCGEKISVERCDIHRRHWTLKEIALIDEIINGNISKYKVADLTKRSYGAVQRKYEKRMIERGLRNAVRNK